MIIRKATKKDLKECFEIQKPDKEWTMETLKNSLSNIFLVVEDKSKLLGYIIGYIDPCMKNDAVIHEVRVNPIYRKKGIGTKLVDAFCKECFKKGVKDVSAGIQPAHLKFYKGCKFKQGMEWINVYKKKRLK